MDDIFLFKCPAKSFSEERVFVTSSITWAKLLGLVSARLSLSLSRDSISHLSLRDKDVMNIEQFAQACAVYSAGDLDCFVVHLGEPRYSLPPLSMSDSDLQSHSHSQSHSSTPEEELAVSLSSCSTSTSTSTSQPLHPVVSPSSTQNIHNPNSSISSNVNSQPDEHHLIPQRESIDAASDVTEFLEQEKELCNPAVEVRDEVDKHKQRRESEPCSHHEHIDEIQADYREGEEVKQPVHQQKQPVQDRQLGGLSHSQQSAGEVIQVQVLHPLSREPLPVDVARDCDWEGLGLSLSDGLSLHSGFLEDGTWGLELLDEDGDTVSSRVNSMKKFWKYQAMQRAAMSRSGDESLVFSLVLPVDSSQRVQAHHGDTSEKSGQKTKVLPSPSNDSECQPSSRHRGGHPEAVHLTPTRQGPPPSHADNRRLIIPSQLSQVPDAVLSTPQQNDEDNESGDETPHSTSSETYKRITDLRRNKQNEDNGKPIVSMDKQEMLQQSVFEACAQGDLVLLQERLEGQDEDKILFLLYTAQSQDNEYSALHYASENGDETTLKWLLLKYKEWNALDIIYVQDHLGYTPLHFLCAGGHVNVLRFIRSDVAGGPTAPIFFGNVRSHDDTSLVHTCVLHAQHDTLMWLFMDNSRAENMNFALEGPLEVNSVNETGACPLHIACALSDIRMARLLVGRGAFVNIIDVNGNTPLFVSCFTNDLIMVQWLYAQGATYSQYNKKGFSALHIASRKGNGNLARWLITNGLGDFKLKSDVLGVSPMDEARLNSHENVYNMFLEMQEAEDEVQSRHADFFSCVQEGRVFDAVEALEVDGVDVDSVLAGGNTALHIACSTGCFEMAEVLVSRYGAEVDTPHIGTGMTPLHVACVHNNDLLVQWLVQRGGANPMTQCWQGNTVFHYVCQAGSMMLVQWFVELGSVDINVSNIDGFTALYMACKHGFINIAKYLVDCGAYPYTSNAYGMTLLHASAGGGKEDITNWLLQTFHDYILVDAQNYNGCTAFYLACASGHLAVAKALYQASPSVLDVHAFAVEDNNSALHIACKNGQLEVVMWLVLELGLQQDLFDALNKRMCSPFQVAKDMNKLKVVEWITMQQPSQQPSISVVENDGKRKTKKKKKIKISLSETQVPEQEENADGSDDDDVNSDVVNKVVEKRKPFASFFACMPVNNFGEVKADVVNGKQERSNNSTSSHANYSKPNIESVTEFSEETNSEALEIYDFINEHDARSIEKRLRSKSKDDIKRILNHVLRDHGRTVIHEACTVADFAVLKALLSTVTKDHVDLNMAERFNGNSPLHILCRHDDSLQVEAILLLLSLGADIGTKNRDGETPMHLLCSFPNKESACKVVQTIIELPRTVLQHLDLAVKNTAGLSLMHVAVRANNLPLVRLLCQYSQSLVNSRSETHVTPLHMASMYGFYEIADTLLVQFDAFVNARDDDGMTALLFACRNGHLRIAKLAVKHGANVFVEEDVAGTALHFACSAGDFAMTKWLVRQGLRPDTENNDGVSPEQVAQDQLREVKAAIVESSDDELRDKEADLVRVTNWLAAWSLADKMGLPVEEVLAEMSIEQNGSKNATVIGKRRTIH